MKDKLNITEFAQLVGKSRQAIYKQVNKKLSPFVTTIDNQKMIDIKAAEEIYSIKVDSQETTKSKPIDNQETTKKLIEMLQKELDNKDKQIAELQKSLDKSQQLIDQEQQLRMIEHKKLLELEEKAAEPTHKKHWWNRGGKNE